MEKLILKMLKMVYYGELSKTWSMQSNSVTRQVTFNWTKNGGKCKNWKFKCDFLGDFQTLWNSLLFKYSKILDFHREFFFLDYFAVKFWAKLWLSKKVQRFHPHPLLLPELLDFITWLELNLTLPSIAPIPIQNH